MIKTTRKSILPGMALALLGGLALYAGTGSATLLSLLTQATIYAIFALGVGLLLRQSGLVSFGHAAFFGSAGYLVALLLKYADLAAGPAILATVLIIGVAAFLLGLVIGRIPGIAFGMLTLAVGQTLYLSTLKSRDLLGGADGLNIAWLDTLFGAPMRALYDPGTMFLVCWVTLVLIAAALAWLVRSRFGSTAAAIRDNEERARYIGIRVLVPRAAIYGLSAAVSAVAGILSALYTGFVSPESLHWSVSGVALMMVILGGFRVLWGPVLGAMLYFLAKDYLGEVTDYWMALLGAALILTVVYAPDGLSGTLVQVYQRLRRPARTAALTRLEEGKSC
ncbi:branched-chain amino acid ABC transporter permease [Marinobacterium aestuariivivens]|uniref:Branched-chain amino acid ABC transporter permease n=1 Tax=Marinobacterium aestuariivivens TaxID=1698799 RepID=A0ABW2A7E1_9GAMM